MNILIILISLSCLFFSFSSVAQIEEAKPNFKIFFDAQRTFFGQPTLYVSRKFKRIELLGGFGFSKNSIVSQDSLELPLLESDFIDAYNQLHVFAGPRFNLKYLNERNRFYWDVLLNTFVTEWKRKAYSDYLDETGASSRIQRFDAGLILRGGYELSFKKRWVFNAHIAIRCNIQGVELTDPVMQLTPRQRKNETIELDLPSSALVIGYRL